MFSETRLLLLSHCAGERYLVNLLKKKIGYCSMASSSNNSGQPLVKDSTKPLLLVAGGAAGGAAALALAQVLFRKFFSSKKKKEEAKKSAETDHARAHSLVWQNIVGALNASQLYIGNRLQLYSTLRQMCAEPGSFVSANELADRTGLHRRWLKEWLAHQAGMGVLQLQPRKPGSDSDGTTEEEYDTLRFRLPEAVGEVFSDESSDEWDMAMIQLVPEMVDRARSMLPTAFKTGIGRPYDDPDVTEAIDKQNRRHIRKVVLPKVLAAAGVLDLLTSGCSVAELGCGGGNLLRALSAAFPKSTFAGYEVSKPAIEHARAQVEIRAAANEGKDVAFGSVEIHDATQPGCALGDEEDGGAKYDVVFIHDVLHDAPFPEQLVAMVRRGLKPGGTFVFADIACKVSSGTLCLATCFCYL